MNFKLDFIKILIPLIIFLNIIEFSYSQSYFGNIILDRREVFDTTQNDWFFAGKFANLFHSLTCKYIIEDELLFSENEEIDESEIRETERNLRATDLFSEVRIELDSVSSYKYDAYILTRDRWTLRPSLLFGIGGNSERWGGRFEELSLFGTGTRISLEALHRNENNIGWQSIIELNQRKLFRSNLKLDFYMLLNKYRTEDTITLQQPFWKLSSEYAYGITGVNNFGNDFIFSNNTNNYILSYFKEKSLTAWISHAWKRKDRIFATLQAHIENIQRARPEDRRAFDNSGNILIAFSSISEDFLVTNKINDYNTEDLVIGGWGSAILGKTFAMGSGNGGESFFYVAGEGEKSYLRKDIYLFGRILAGSALAKSRSAYTYQEFYGTGFYNPYPWLIICGRVRQQTVWNWFAVRQLLLDNDFGLRGYTVNNIRGDNRFISNLEVRFFPDWKFWIFNFSGVLFWDIGSAWNQQVDLSKTIWHNSMGFGFRIHDSKSSPTIGIYRFDFAYNFDEHKFAEIIFSTNQFFSAFESHKFRLPRIMGQEFDYE